MLPPWATALLSVGAFVSFALLLALVRRRSGGKFTVETREIAAAVVALGIGLFLFGWSARSRRKPIPLSATASPPRRRP